MNVKGRKGMYLQMLKGKIHRATVIQAELDYVGSITVDQDLLDAAGILEYEKVQIVDVNNGQRFETYTISGERGSGMICLNGAAARCVQKGDKIIIMCYASMTPEEAKENSPKVVFVDENNQISRITRYEKHGRLEDM
jgi:aspartate 1-decarboxylase